MDKFVKRPYRGFEPRTLGSQIRKSTSKAYKFNQVALHEIRLVTSELTNSGTVSEPRRLEQAGQTRKGLITNEKKTPTFDLRRKQQQQQQQQQQRKHQQGQQQQQHQHSWIERCNNFEFESDSLFDFILMFFSNVVGQCFFV